MTDRFKSSWNSIFRKKPKKTTDISAPLPMYQDAEGSNAESRNPYTHMRRQESQQSRIQDTQTSAHTAEYRHETMSDNQDEITSGDINGAEFPWLEGNDDTDNSSETCVEQHESKAAHPSPELDPPQPVNAMNDPEARGREVREYRDVAVSYHTARAANPFYSGNTMSSGNANSALQSEPELLGQWRCCKCDSGFEVYKHPASEHFVNTLTCVCPHRSCENCTLTGRLKPYKPVQEPIPVQLSDDKSQQVQFGVFCGKCGLSWRAQTVKDSVRQKVSAVPKTLAKAGGHPLEKLRQSKSLGNLLGELNTKVPVSKMTSNANLRAMSDEMEKEHGKQAKSIMVNFSGIACTCGHTLDSSALCFQIVEPEEAAAAGPPDVVHKEPSFTASPEDRIKGIGNSVIKIKRNGRTIYHPNPLASNPVTEEDLKWLNSIMNAGRRQRPLG